MVDHSQATVPWDRWSYLPIVVLLAIVMPTSTAAAQEDSAPGAAEGAQNAQSPAISLSYVPIGGGGRVDWIVDDTIGPFSLAAGALKAAFQTALDTPKRWGRSPSGFGKRMGNREIDVGLSSSIEAGLGAIWGEEPRYIPSHRSGIWSRVRYATKTVVVTQRQDGHLAPAWGRYAGNVLNNVIENTWLPSSVTTWRGTLVRSGGGFLSRWGGNLWREFWPDVRDRLMRSHLTS